MEIYIIRHGDAWDPTAPWITSDEMRPLTDKGRDEVALMARLLGRLGVRPDAILSSPLVRARQTAEILAEELGAGGPSESAHLAPGGLAADVLNDITALGRGRAVVLAGHMPGVGRLAGYLLGQEIEFGIPFRTAEICRIDLPDDALVPGLGDLRWLIPPKVARKLLGEQ